MQPRRITVEEVKSAMDQEHAPVFVDARSADAWSKAGDQVPNAVRVPPDEAKDRIRDVPRGRPVVTYCT
jgi:rhodanese-related sulfurtransferase